ncbi:MAG: RNA polymerase sigma factor [Bacteroidetes bacterium]|nr:RNA polymerase sigma factor [Bacteroidota bacterium]
MKNIRDEEKARDIIQETYAKVWQKVDDIPFEKGKSYLFTTAYHTMIDEIRKSEKMQRMELHHTPIQTSQNGYSDLKEVLDEALKTLSEIQRSVVLLRDYEGYSYAEIGQITGLSEPQVKVYIFRARMNLKKYLQKIENVLEIPA